MSGTMLTLIQTAMTAAMAAWMFTGFRDNILYPAMNREAVALVLRMEAMETEWPVDFAHVRHRRVTDEGRITLLYRLIVAWEGAATLALLIGTGALALALLGAVPAGVARDAGGLGAAAFALNWAGFLIGGNHWAYWYCHQGSQHTHFCLLLWGVLGVLLMAMPA